jgi:hypothetical protein
MYNVTVEKLEKKFPGEGAERFQQIASLGGYGNLPITDVEKSFHAGLDIKSALDDANKTISPAKKDKIRELVGLVEDVPVMEETPAKSKKEGK